MDEVMGGRQLRDQMFFGAKATAFCSKTDLLQLDKLSCRRLRKLA